MCEELGHFAGQPLPLSRLSEEVKASQQVEDARDVHRWVTLVLLPRLEKTAEFIDARDGPSTAE
jgi:hypothetical protein